MNFTKKKSVYFAGILLILGIVLVSVNATAHNPANMSLEYDSSEGKLSVTITHTVADPNTHYIESVEVKVDGMVVETKTYTSQPSTSSFTYEYDLTVDDGSTIEVNAVCNIGGSLKRTLTVGDAAEDSPNGETTIPSFPIFGLIAGITVFTLISIIKLKLRKKNS